MYEQHTKVADAATVVSSLGALTSWVVDALPLVQFIAGIIAIIAGIFAAIYHAKKIRELDRKK